MSDYWWILISIATPIITGLIFYFIFYFFWKILEGITWIGETIWEGITWICEKIWEGITWIGEKIWDGLTWPLHRDKLLLVHREQNSNNKTIEKKLLELSKNKLIEYKSNDYLSKINNEEFPLGLIIAYGHKKELKYIQIELDKSKIESTIFSLRLYDDHLYYNKEKNLINTLSFFRIDMEKFDELTLEDLKKIKERYINDIKESAILGYNPEKEIDEVELNFIILKKEMEE